MIEVQDIDLPAALIPVTDLLAAGVGPIRSRGLWCKWPSGIISIQLVAQLRLEDGPNFPLRTVWHLTVSTKDYPASIHILPDLDEGVTATYPHQEAVTLKRGKELWRGGKPCLGDPGDVWGERYGTGLEPDDLAARLVWHVERFAGWCLSAASGQLHKEGDPYELPPLPNRSNSEVIGFCETEESYTFTQAVVATLGTAKLVEVSSPQRGLAVQEWRTQENELIYAPPWGSLIKNASGTGAPCLWLRLSSIPILEAWQLPRTYRDLKSALHREGFDLGDIFASLGATIRKANIKKPATILFGFPIPKNFGEEPKRYHWIAIQEVPISKRTTTRQGFRGTEKNRREFDRDLASSQTEIDWVTCENWAPDQIRTRLRSLGTTLPSVLVIGAGSLGSQISETLVRMGVSEIGVVDSDRLSAGNLCRHALNLSSVGKNKARELAHRLNSLQPDVQAEAFEYAFPLIAPEGIQVPAHYDVILDCTGEDDVFKGLAAIEWKAEVLFISLSMNWGAQGLLVWSSRGTVFPALDASARLNALSNLTKPNHLEERIEGIGCWHPVFPADAADVQIWAGFGAKFLIEMAKHGNECCGIYSFNEDGTVGFKNG